jgi:hypothetical protein
MREPPAEPPTPAAERARFRATLVRVLVVQAAALLALWLLQSRYTS